MDAEQPLSRTAASTAVEIIGWRLVLGTLQASVPTSGLAEAVRLAAAAVTAAGPDADDHLRLDLRPDRLLLAVHTRAVGRGGPAGGRVPPVPDPAGTAAPPLAAVRR